MSELGLISQLGDLKQKLSDEGHFYQNYNKANDLLRQFGDQVTKLLPQLYL